MRFRLGAIPDSPDFLPAPPWKPLREPSSAGLMQLIAIPIGLTAAAIVSVLWLVMTPMPGIALLLTPAKFATVLLVIAGIIVVHELIHAAFHPQAGRSARSILGFWPSRMVFFAHYDGETSRERFLTIVLMPLTLISILPLVVAAVTQTSSGWAMFISSFNAFMACGDLFGTGLILAQVPLHALVRNKGWYTYWREPDNPGRLASPS